MKAFTPELIAEIESFETYTSMLEFLRAAKSCFGEVAQILDVSIQSFVMLGTVANEEQQGAIREKIMAAFDRQPDTDDYPKKPQEQP